MFYRVNVTSFPFKVLSSHRYLNRAIAAEKKRLRADADGMRVEVIECNQRRLIGSLVGRGMVELQRVPAERLAEAV